jgi:hypothetical protein
MGGYLCHSSRRQILRTPPVPPSLGAVGTEMGGVLIAIFVPKPIPRTQTTARPAL